MAERKIIRVSGKDVLENCHLFKTHVEYVKHRFMKEHGCEVIDHKMLSVWRGDSDTHLVMEYHGVVGESLRQVKI